MNEFVLIQEGTGNKKHFDSRSEAEDMARDLPGEYRIESANGEEPEPKQGSAEDIDNRTPDDVEVIDHGNTEGMDMSPEEIEKMKEGYEKRAEERNTDLPEKSLTEDPINWVPSHFVDEIQGVPTINRKGYAVLAEQYNISVVSESVTLASETDFEYAEFRATARKQNGTEYTGFGSAHIERQDGDDKHLLNELAETRAMKRAVAWATGVGMTAMEEMKNEL